MTGVLSRAINIIHSLISNSNSSIIKIRLKGPHLMTWSKISTACTLSSSNSPILCLTLIKTRITIILTILSMIWFSLSSLSPTTKWEEQTKEVSTSHSSQHPLNTLTNLDNNLWSQGSNSSNSLSLTLLPNSSFSNFNKTWWQWGSRWTRTEVTQHKTNNKWQWWLKCRIWCSWCRTWWSRDSLCKEV